MRMFSMRVGLALIAGFTVEAVASETKLGATVKDLAKTKQVNADFQSVRSALVMYKLNTGAYPTEKQGLSSLVAKPTLEPVPGRWVQIMREIPKDPWGRTYLYIERKEKDQIVHVMISDGPELDKASDNIEIVLEKAAK